MNDELECTCQTVADVAADMPTPKKSCSVHNRDLGQMITQLMSLDRETGELKE